MAEQTRFRAIKGVRDILPPESSLWNWFEATARRVMETYGYREIRLPIFEETELFARSIGADTDVVTKEMYTFYDPFGFLDNSELLEPLKELGIDTAKLQRLQDQFLSDSQTREKIGQLRKASLTLRPEATASVLRAYIEHGMHTLPGNVKLYYVGPMFRRERPQKGRYRQFYQVGAEVLGQSDHPAIDAELIEMLTVLLAECRIENWTLLVNSIGCKDCRPKYVQALRSALETVKSQMCADCQRRAETNPLRVLDCKVEADQPIIAALPTIQEHLDEPCRDNFKEFQRQLKLREITSYMIAPRLVRGLDYYMRTTFEITSPVLGAQNALVGGGRYDGLAELLGGPPTKGIGFALGTDRFIEAIQEAKKVDASRPLDIFVAWIGAEIYPLAVTLARTLRRNGYSVEVPPEEMKLKKSLSLADRLGVRYALLVGETEKQAGMYVLRRLADGEQVRLSEADLIVRLNLERGQDPAGKR